MLAHRLRFQFLALAPGVPALACYFQGAFRIGTGIAAAFFPSAGTELQAGCAHLDPPLMGDPLLERALLSRRNCSVENLTHRVERVSVLRSGAHLSSHIRQHRTSGNNNLFRFAHDGQISAS